MFVFDTLPTDTANFRNRQATLNGTGRHFICDGQKWIEYPTKSEVSDDMSEVNDTLKRIEALVTTGNGDLSTIASNTTTANDHLSNILTQATAAAASLVNLEALTAANAIDFFMAVSAGLLTGWSSEIIAGHNPDVDTGAIEDLWEGGGTKTYLGAADQIDFTSTSASDTGTILVSGPNASYVRTTEVVTLNGTGTATTSGSFLDIEKIVTISATNIGEITATDNATGAVTVQKVLAGSGASFQIHRIVPDGKEMYIVYGDLNVHKGAGGGRPEVDFTGKVTPFGQGEFTAFEGYLDEQNTNNLVIEQKAAQVAIPAKAKIRITADADTSNTNVRGRLYVVYRDL